MKLKQKLIAATLSVMMLTSYLSTLTNVVVAVGEELVNQNTKTNHANVEFNTYFDQETDHSKTFEIGEEAKLYVKVKVNNMGYLKNGVVQFEDANFVVDNNLDNEMVQASSKNEIKLKQVNNGNEKIIEVPITMENQDKIDKSIFAKTSKAKFTGIYIDENGNERKIEKEIQNEVKWKGTAEIELAGEVTKFVPYEKGEEKGVLLQTTIQAGIKDNNLPIENLKLEVSMPEIKVSDETIVKPERITVTANTTKGTNGKIGNSFSNENYTYNEETGKIEITVKNEVEEGKITWIKDTKDEYLVNYVFVGEEEYNYVKEKLEKAKQTIKTEEEKKAGQVNENAITGAIEVKANVKVYNLEETSLEKEGNINYEIEQVKSEIINSFVESTTKVSKGYIYANYDKEQKQANNQVIEEKKDTNYEVSYNVQVNDKQLVDEIKIETVKESFIDKEGQEYDTKVENTNNIYSKVVKIEESIFNKILGEEGKIEVLAKTEEIQTKEESQDEQENEKQELTKIAEITKETEKDEKGNYIVDVSASKVNELTIVTTKPVTEGNIIINVEKAVSSELNYSKEQMQSFTKISLNVQNQEIELTEPVSKAQISIGTKRLSTVIENKDVELRVVLDTSNTENALFKNPELQIVLPKSVEKVNIKSAILLLDDELKIESTKVVEQDGNKVIKITLKGTQTQYMNSGITNGEEQENVISKGANIVIKADITLKKLAPSENANILLYYTNENTDIFENTYKPKAKIVRYSTRSAKQDVNAIGLASTRVQIAPPLGLVIQNKMTGYNGINVLENISKDARTETISIYSEAKEVNISGTIINNYEENLTDVKILGRIPAEGNKKIDASQDLGSNLTMKMKEKITLSQGVDSYQVFYSTNPEATSDINNTNNGWTLTPSDLSQVKSYLIVINEEIAPSENIEFSYKTELPANLPHGKNTYTTYKVYCNTQVGGATVDVSEIAGTIGLTTGEGADLQINIKSPRNTAKEGEIITITATVKNNGTVKAKNAKLNIIAPEGTEHTSTVPINEEKTQENGNEKVINLGDIDPKETITETYELRMTKETPEYSGDKDIENIITASAENQNGESKSNTLIIKRLKGELSIINRTISSGVLQTGDKILYEIKVENISNDLNLNNVIVNIPIPNGIKIVDVYNYEGLSNNQIRDNITINNNNIVVKIDRLLNRNEGKNIRSINLIVQGDGFEGIHELTVTAKADGLETYYSNVKTIKGMKVDLAIEQKGPEKLYVKEGTEYKYQYIIKNNAEFTADKVNVEIDIPEGIRLVKAEYIDSNGLKKQETWSSDNKLKLNIGSLAPNSKIDIYVTVVADLLKDKNEKEIITKGSIRKDELEKSYSNEVKVTIEYDSIKHKFEVNDIKTEQGTYKITGTAWIDSNKDGKREEKEEILSNVQVLLIDKSTSKIVKDIDTGLEKITTTDGNGKYEFSNLPKGEYIVVFLYDAGKYTATQYQAKDVGESYNSDVDHMEIILNGEKRYSGVTNTIKIINENARDIDCGVYVAEKFDLRLDKYISKVTITTQSKGTKVYNYNNSKITKREVKQKDVNNSTMVIEYKIVVTNEGQIPGYAKKIIDYLPQNVKFSSELNKDWYIADNNGTVFNTSLANKKIEPGQSQEIKLVLSVNITDKTIGTNINNNAEIYESYNEQGIEDYDSKEANMIETEDDISNADVILSIATGKIIIYVVFTFCIISLISIGIYVIKKKILN